MTLLRGLADGGDNGARRIRVRVPGASDATRTLTIRYLVRNAVRHFYPGDLKGTANAGREFDELYWNATGNDWAFPIEHATAHVVDRKSTRLNSSHSKQSRMPSSA